MLKFLRLFLSILFAVSFLMFTPPVFAEQQFSNSYEVRYDIAPDGLTHVTENITLKNLTDRYYASQFSLSIGASDIENIQAFDSGGSLDSKLGNQGNKSTITVKFSQQVAGKDKEYRWTLKFDSKDFAQNQGKVWQVSVPKIVATPDLDQYSLTLSVPVSFGDPASILPEPKSQNETGSKVNLIFTKEQLLGSGILANFGNNQFFDFSLTYHLNNNSILPTILKLPVPPDTAYQQVLISSINPKPENVVVDRDGNYLALFKTDRFQSYDVVIYGQVKNFISSQKKDLSLSPEQKLLYTSNAKYWEKDNPLIQSKLLEIFKDTQPSSVKEKAQLINNFVVNILKFSNKKLQAQDFERLGGLTAMTNSENALAAEFSDLFVTMARAAGIPSRSVVGYAYTSNLSLRPLSLPGQLHSWAEYFEPELGWVMVDPTWSNTSGGVDYFNKFDLNHIVFAISGVNSEYPTLPGSYNITFSGLNFEPHPDAKASFDLPSQIYGRIPAFGKFTVENDGNTFFPDSTLTILAQKLKITTRDGLNSPSFNGLYTPVIPPFGHLDYPLEIHSDSLTSTFPDTIKIYYADKIVSRQAAIRPFYTIPFFGLFVAGFVAVAAGFYTLSVFIFFKKKRVKTHASPKRKRKKRA